MSEWMAWGAGNVPSRHLFPPPLSSSGRSGKSSMLRALKSAAARLGLDLGTGQDSALVRNRNSRPYDPSHGY